MKKILVVDDNPVCRELMREALQGNGVEVLEACDGHQALQMIRQSPPDLVLLDLQMPPVSGYEVLAQIRSDPSTADIVVAALTAYAMRGDREKGLSAGFNDYITKPIDVANLRKSVERLLNE